jgi:predicted Zn-dependent protease
MIARIYTTTKRVAEARRTYEQQIHDNPNDPGVYIDYGNLLFGMQPPDFLGAAAQFKSVLDISGLDASNRAVALFNLGAVYKNWGAHLQDSIRKVVGSKAPTTAQLATFQGPLNESVKYFEQLHSLKPDDYAVLTELINLYDVLGKKEKISTALVDLERLNSVNSDKCEYWRAMSRVYAIVGDEKKARSADAEAIKRGC